MTPLRLAVYRAPIPIPGTHRREPMFDAEDGWTLERNDDGDVHVTGHGLDFWTEPPTSWIVKPAEPKPHLTIPEDLQAKAREMVKPFKATTKVQAAIRKQKLEGE